MKSRLVILMCAGYIFLSVIFAAAILVDTVTKLYFIKFKTSLKKASLLSIYHIGVRTGVDLAEIFWVMLESFTANLVSAVGLH